MLEVAAQVGSRLYVGRVLALLFALSPLGVVTNCGGSAQPEAAVPSGPPAKAPVSEVPSQPQSVQSPDEGSAETQRLESDERWESDADKTSSREPPQGERSSFEQFDLPRALTAIADFDTQFSSAIALSAPNCAEAETYRRAVCQLAERICALEEGLPSTVSERHCPDSRTRCVDATSRYAQRCER